uniref:Helicase C-terminal domain-containing protein n=1 Tax=Mesocestoides corti TaxID=53468 RepID=A0A5K3ENL7_MESCO
MRRSAAPSALSQGFKRPNFDMSKPTTQSVVKHQIPAPSRQILQPISLDTNSDSQQYEIVYAKRSTKKHKKWENDGFLLVSGVQVKINSIEGKTIASANLKAAVVNSLEIGMVLVVGGYECQLIALLSDQSETRVPPIEPQPTVLAPKLPKSLKTQCGRPQPIQPDDNAFVLPRPPNNHMWAHNPEGLEVTDVFLSGRLATRLHAYQLQGIRFLYECVLGYRKAETQDAFELHEEDIYGGILADEMGLGKTVQVIGLLAVLLKQGPYGGRPVVRRCLIVTPGSLVGNWQKEFNKWTNRVNITTYCVSQDNPIKAYFSQMRPPPVIIMSYEMLIQNSSRMTELANLDLVVCDEGHRLKNLGIKTTAVLKKLPARRRIILTGTPIQNDLTEFWSLAEFVAPGCLAASREEYRERIVNPLSRSPHPTELFQTIATTDGQVSEVETTEVVEAAQRLKRALGIFLLRRTSDVISRRLPSKVEQIVFCEASDIQRELQAVMLKWVECQLENEENNVDFGKPPAFLEIDEDSLDTPHPADEADDYDDAGVGGAGVLACIMAFRKIYNHPSLLFEALKQPHSRKQSLPSGLVGSLRDLLHQRLPPTERSACSASVCRTSGKLAVLQSLLAGIFRMPPDPISRGGSHRLVLVSNFTQTLDLLEPICQNVTMAPCLRIDGKTPTKQRIQIVDRFNSPTCVEKVLLLSSKAGGTGLNLIGADYLVLFDIDWNPATDEQELFQPSPCETTCWTHDLLGCRCHLPNVDNDCHQSAPYSHASSDDEEDLRTFQIGRPRKRPKTGSASPINAAPCSARGLGQISTWRHLLTPESISSASPLLVSSKIRAVFQHITTSDMT